MLGIGTRVEILNGENAGLLADIIKVKKLGKDAMGRRVDGGKREIAEYVLRANNGRRIREEGWNVVPVKSFRRIKK
jgi:hypothetical protein